MEQHAATPLEVHFERILRLSISEFSQNEKREFLLHRRETHDFTSHPLPLKKLDHELLIRFASWNLKQPDLYCCFNSSSLFSCTVKIKNLPQDPVLQKERITMEAGHLIPCRLEKLIWYYDLIHSPDTKVHEVRFVAGRRELLEALSTILLATGASLVSLGQLESTSMAKDFSSFLIEKSSQRPKLLPPTFIRIQKIEPWLPYILITLLLLLFLIFSTSLYFQIATNNLAQQTAKANPLLKIEDKRLQQKEVVKKNLKELQQQGAELFTLIETRDSWPLLLEELQEKIPTHSLWITELSPVITEEEKRSKTNKAQPKATASFLPEGKISALEIKGLCLENSATPQTSLNDLAKKLQASPFFVIEKENPETIFLLRTTPDGTSFATPFIMKLPLRSSINSRAQ